MNTKQADTIIEAVTDILKGHDLVAVARLPGDSLPDIRVHQTFDKAYRVDYKDDACSIGLCDTYGVMTGSERWTIDPDKRAIHAETTNGLGEYLAFSWVVADDDGGSELWNRMRDWNKAITSVQSVG